MALPNWRPEPWGEPPISPLIPPDYVPGGYPPVHSPPFPLPRPRGPSPIKLLSIDGGGIQGLAALITVRELMQRMQREAYLPDMPLPCEYFDLIVGTGVGGLIAVMLGRLRMSVDEALDWFQEIISLVFSQKKRWGEGLFKATNLELVVGRMVVKHAGYADASMVDDGTGCRTIVCAMSAHAMRGVTLFRSYHWWENRSPDCTIVQAVRATTARPGLFKPVEIDDHGVKLLFVDSGLGYNNPTSLMLEEAKKIFQDLQVGCIISVGTGQTRAASAPASRRISWTSHSDPGSALQRIATDCEETDQDLQKRFHDTPNIYFRFNVKQGLQDTGMTDLKKLSEVAAHARHNNQLVEVSTKLNNAAKAATSGGALIPAAHLDGAVTRAIPKARTKSCPPASIVFTGRTAVLTQMKNYFMDDSGSSERHIFVLHGLGGSGKTQIALKFVEIHRDAFSEVFYIDASSAETISTDLTAIAFVKKAGSTADDALTWLAARNRKWLMVFNNADNTSLDLQRYFPASSHGDVLITTRNRQMINIAGEIRTGVKAECQISGMQAEDAKELLLRASGIPLDDDIDGYGAILVEELGYLALAIIQAGAYIQVNECTLEEYIAMYRKNKLVLEESRKIILKSDDYGWTVYTTWCISYDQLKGRTAEFLRLLGFFHHEGITESMFQYACERLPSYQPELISSPEHLAIKDGVNDFLKSSFCAVDDAFDKSAFLDFIRELRSYSLVDFNPFDRTYSIHSLLQDWVRRTAADNASNSHPSAALLLALSIRYDPDSLSSHAIQRQLLPHVDAVLNRLEVMPCIANVFAWVYQQNGRWKAAGALLSLALDASKRMLGETHPTTIYNAENLATTLSRQKQWSEAEKLRQQAMDACQKTLGTEHAHTLWVIGNLAQHYSEQGQFQKAEDLQLRIVDAKKRAVGATHLDTLQAMGNLAIICVNSGQFERAARLQESVYITFRRLAGPQHPDTLTSMQHLAITFAKEERWDKSITLQREVVDACVVVFGPKHHTTRESLAMLAKLRRNMSKSLGYRPRPEPSNYRWFNPEPSGHQSEDGSDSSEDSDSSSLALANNETSQNIPLPIPNSVEIGDGLLGGTDSPSLAPTDSETPQNIHMYIRNEMLGPETLSKGDSREPLKVQQKLSELSINSPGEPLWKSIPSVDAVPSTTPPRSPHHQDQNATSSKALNDASQTASDRAITAVSTSDEDDWTTGRSFKGRPL